jgi:hypothetical protein
MGELKNCKLNLQVSNKIVLKDVYYKHVKSQNFTVHIKIIYGYYLLDHQLIHMKQDTHQKHPTSFNNNFLSFDHDNVYKNII